MTRPHSRPNAFTDAAILDIHLGAGPGVGPIAEVLQGCGIPFLFTTDTDKSGVQHEFAGSPQLTKPFNPSAIGPALVAVSSRTERSLDARRRLPDSTAG